MQKLNVFRQLVEEKWQMRHALANSLDCKDELKSISCLPDEERITIIRHIRERQDRIVRELRHRYSTNDFEMIRQVGSGAFGVVSLVRCKRSGLKFALKQMKKDGLLKKNHRERLIAEKTLLTELRTEWVVSLYRTFQDHQHLYMLMEYLPGGDFMSHLIRMDSFSEDQTRFYMAELIEAVHCVHRFGFIHRDIKPDNIVLTSTGHLKLIDFGLCKFDPGVKTDALASDERVLQNSSQPVTPITSRRLGHWTRAQLRSSVGTPQYMAPEVLNKMYDHTSDFWSVGMIAYECLMGGTPFYDEAASTRPNNKPDVRRILHKVMHFREYLLIPFPGKSLSSDAISFLKGLLCEAPGRMRYDQIRAHSFFKPIRWDKLRSIPAPIIPKLHHDSVHAGGAASESPALPVYKPLGIHKDRNLDFVGYTYNRWP